jgi:hypothetical protein
MRYFEERDRDAPHQESVARMHGNLAKPPTDSAEEAFSGKAGLSLFRKGAARLVIGDLPRVQALKSIGLQPDPVFTLYLPEVTGVLDDHFESWFVTSREPPAHPPEGLESVVGLGESQQWLPPPSAPVPGLVREDAIP